MGDAHLAELFRLLYPEPYRLTLPGERAPDSERASDGDCTEYLLLPSARRPRLALPVAPRQLRAAVVRHLPRPRSGRERLRNAALRTVLTLSAAPFRDRVRVTGTGTGGGPSGSSGTGGSGTGGSTGGGDSLPAHLAAVLGQPVHCAVHVGGALRANRKPVLEILDAQGNPLGFAKLGGSPLTRELVRAETRALATLAKAGLRHTTVPEIWYAGAWHGQELLVQQALPVWRPVAPRPGEAVSTAMVEVAAACGLSSGAFEHSGYHLELRTRLEAVAGRPDDRGLGAALNAAGRDLFAKAGEVALTFGAWHGDWTPWNTHVTRESVLVWDWERFGTGVPLGLDALHWWLQALVDAGTPAAAAAGALPHRAAQLAAPFGVAPAAARLTAALYLLDIGARYLADRLDTTGQRLSRVDAWLLPVLRQEIDQANWNVGD